MSYTAAAPLFSEYRIPHSAFAMNAIPQVLPRLCFLLYY